MINEPNYDAIREAVERSIWNNEKRWAIERAAEATKLAIARSTELPYPLSFLAGLAAFKRGIEMIHVIKSASFRKQKSVTVTASQTGIDPEKLQGIIRDIDISAGLNCEI